MSVNSKSKVCFEITEEQSNRIKQLPRTLNLSEKLREVLDTILMDVLDTKLMDVEEKSKMSDSPE